METFSLEVMNGFSNRKKYGSLGSKNVSIPENKMLLVEGSRVGHINYERIIKEHYLVDSTCHFK